MTKIQTHNLGFPRIGENRELKKALETFWSGKIDKAQLQSVAREIRSRNWQLQRDAGIGLIPSNDFSFYDQMLDTAALVGAIPARFANHHLAEKSANGEVSLATYFAMARGAENHAEADCACGSVHSSHEPLTAMEMTKWFDTNYHYLVPELTPQQAFQISSQKPFTEFAEALTLGIKTKPVLIGPVTFLTLSKIRDGADSLEARLALLENLLPVYSEILQRLAKLGAEWVQLDEPIFSLDLNDLQRSSLAKTYAVLAKAAPSLKLIVANYFGELRENRTTFLQLSVHALHIDAVRAADEVEIVVSEFPNDKILSLGVVDGRNIWRNDFEKSLALVQKTRAKISAERLWLAPSCSLLHSPVSLRAEIKLDAETKSWLAFAEEKLHEVTAICDAANGELDAPLWNENRAAIASRKTSARIHNDAVKARNLAVSDDDTRRESPYSVRAEVQRAKLNLPLFPTTTIGSFPQTPEVRAARARFKKGAMTVSDYEQFLENEIRECVTKQESIGIDVIVHGEFERNDMVEYFGEQLDGFAFMQNGWVQSYGSRCVKPPIIFGDVARPQPMTVRWSRFAQSLTAKPMKGMLTGPITILQWSFVRDDQPRSETARQIALAISDEVRDLESAGIGVIQIDEPALREGLPLRRADWKAYLDWAVEAFRLSSSGVRDETQIHTHMCYCEFNDIIDSIAALDADVISIETSRSNMELLRAFADFQYPNEVGPGVWDIHSPRVPSTEEMFALLELAAKVVPAERLWVNPDCGLKTRRWEETIASLKNMVAAARIARETTAAISTR